MPMGWLYITYHLLREPETAIDLASRKAVIAMAIWHHLADDNFAQQCLEMGEFGSPFFLHGRKYIIGITPLKINMSPKKGPFQ